MSLWYCPTCNKMFGPSLGCPTCTNAGSRVTVDTNEPHRKMDTHDPRNPAPSDRAPTDNEMLDAVNENSWHVCLNTRSDHWTVQKWNQVVGNIGKGRTLREAIAAAMRGGNEGKPQ